MSPVVASRPSAYVLPLIVAAQFGGTSVWFAGNGVLPELVRVFALPATATSALSTAVQFGFIVGTLIFALFTLADRYSPSRVFFVSALAAALFNGVAVWSGHTYGTLLFSRFATGFFLAGIYPVGMKIAADYYGKGLGKSLGYLVGALVLGTALPHLLREFAPPGAWRPVIYGTSLLAALGGIAIILFLADGPYRKAAGGFDAGALVRVFRNRSFRGAAFGYFGHMWELYAFWVFVPMLLTTYGVLHPQTVFAVSRWSFAVIAIGGPACVLGGYLSQQFGPRQVAIVALSSSGSCCVLAPAMLFFATPALFLGFLLFWGSLVVMDSPLFSTLVAQNAPAEGRGTALTIVNSIGFAITIFSIQLVGWLLTDWSPVYGYAVLVVGPVLGLIGLRYRTVAT